MKKSFLIGVLSLALGSLSAWGTMADAVKINLDGTLAKEVNVKGLDPLSHPWPGLKRTDGGGEFKKWQYIAVPVEVIATLRDKDQLKKGQGPELVYVDEMKLHIYALFMDKKAQGTQVLLDKEIAYVDIPVVKGKEAKKKPFVSTMYGGVFISPQDAKKIIQTIKDKKAKEKNGAKREWVKPEEGDLAPYFTGIAIEASRRDSNIQDKSGKSNTEQEPFYINDSAQASKLKEKKWWNARNLDTSSGAVLRSIAETPYALHYAPLFPATRPLVADTIVGSLTGEKPDAAGEGTVAPSLSESVGASSRRSASSAASVAEESDED